MVTEPIRPAQVETVPGTYNYRLLTDYPVSIRGKFFTVPAGFVTDFATIPRALWAFYPAGGKYKEAAIVHDYLLKMGYLREYCDRMFYFMMKDGGISARYYLPIYWGVSLFTWWKKWNRNI